MKKFLSILMILSFLLTGFSVYATSEEAQSAEKPDASVTDGCHSLDAQMGILGERQLITNCTAAFLYEYTTDTLLYSWNGDMRINPSSLVKIVTAYIAIKEGSLEDKVTVHSDSFSSLPHDAAMTGFSDGEILTLEDLLNCMMLNSGNDAAIAIAEHIAGSQDAFVGMMNEYALELGCTETNFTNVHGMYDSNQYSTCRDIARILDDTVKDEYFMKLFGSVYYTVPATNKKDDIRLLTTGNFHLTQDEMETYYDGRVTGGRTGVDINDDRCLASTASKDGLDVICIIMGAKMVYHENGYTVNSFGGYHEVSDLLDYGFDGFKSVQILHEGQILKQLDIENGECDLTIGSRKEVSTVIPADIYLEDLNFVYSDAASVHSAPIEKGQYISKVRISYGNLVLAEADLFAMNSVKTINDSYVIETKDHSGQTVWIIVSIIIAVVAVAAFLFAGLPRLKHLRYMRRRKKRQMAAQRRRT